mgnify:CR=1 FL=1
MSLKNHFTNFLKGNISLKDVWYYIQGNFRYKLFYSKKFNTLIRKHIKEQIDIRIKNMNQDCYDKGECIKCGCYPKMMNKKTWRDFKRGMWLTSGDYKWLFVEGILSRRTNMNNN